MSLVLDAKWNANKNDLLLSRKPGRVSKFFVGGDPDYIQPGATSYDGVDDYYLRNGAFVDAPVAAEGIILSAWMNPIAVQGSVPNENYALFCSTQNWNAPFPAGTELDPIFAYGIYDDSGYAGASEKLIVYVQAQKTVAGVQHTVYAEGVLPSDVYPDGSHHHFLATVDFQSGAVQMYFDDAPMMPGPYDGYTAGLPFTLDYSVTPKWLVSAVINNFTGDNNPRVFYKGCQAELLWEPVSAVGAIPDLSVVANRRKFITADRKPVFLGAHGEIPFGTPPIFYSPQGNGTNLGRGGNLDKFGNPGPCGSHP